MDTVQFPTLPDPQYLGQERNKILPRDLFSSGTLPGVTEMSVGDTRVKISGTDGRFVINDGTNDRVWIGNLDA